MSRREKIELMLQQEPNDPFLRYSLAMEFRKEENSERSLPLFESLISDTPPYIPAFLMVGQQCVELGEIERARTFLRTGIEEARIQGDHHAAAEMAELLAQLGAAGE